MEFGITLTITEEAYTSKASFLDGDSLPKHGEKPEGWKASGERVKRGLYRSRDGHVVNADCNGSANIMKKVATQLSLDLTEVGRGSLTLPRRVDLFNGLSKSYRKRSEASCIRDRGVTSFENPLFFKEGRCQKDTLEEEILVGIPNAVVLTSKTVGNSEIRTEPNVPSRAVQLCPKRVIIPMPVEVQRALSRSARIRNKYRNRSD
jgi:hypothetical protein